MYYFPNAKAVHFMSFRPATGKVSTIWCYLPTLDTKRTKMLRSAGFVNVLFLSYIELLILQVFEIEIFLHYT